MIFIVLLLMISIRDLLNKIKWDPKETPGDYVLYYYDRIEKLLKEIRFKDIKEISEGFILVESTGKDVDIPLHRIKKVVRKGTVVWERKS